MDALTKMNVFLLVLCAVLLGMACVPADRVRAWRAGINPSAPELPGASFVVARVLFVALAIAGVCTAVQGFGVSDRMSWSDSELTSAVHQATDDLDGYAYTMDETGSSAYFTDFASLTEEKVTRYGGGDAPEIGVSADPADTDTDAEAHLTVTASGADDAFCVHLRRTRWKRSDYTPPGLNGDPGTLTFRGYRLKAAVRTGEC
ncbi:hypothetical protein ABT133_11180 [Streptomyces sp. NPDC001835]|uniref:hypothetical protein n=1 Tax=Streptomyces sp. NPDC001835 TaxID=3154528 RepID=UPI00332A55A2